MSNLEKKPELGDKLKKINILLIGAYLGIILFFIIFSSLFGKSFHHTEHKNILICYLILSFGLILTWGLGKEYKKSNQIIITIILLILGAFLGAITSFIIIFVGEKLSLQIFNSSFELIQILRFLVVLFLCLVIFTFTVYMYRRKLKNTSKEQAVNTFTKSDIAWFVFAVILIVAFLSNPKQEKHISTVQNEVEKFMSEEILNEDDDSWASSMGLMIGYFEIKREVTKAISSENCYLFSLTNARWEDESPFFGEKAIYTKNIGIGFLGKVYIFGLKKNSPKKDKNTKKEEQSNSSSSKSDRTNTYSSDEEIITDTYDSNYGGYSIDVFENFYFLTNEWNQAHSLDNLNQLYQLFDNTVLFYGLTLSKDECIAKKRSLLNKYTSFEQEIVTYGFSVQEIEVNKYKCSFTKRVITEGKSNDYPSYLIFRKYGDNWKIIAESDLITDRNLANKK